MITVARRRNPREGRKSRLLAEHVHEHVSQGALEVRGPALEHVRCGKTPSRSALSGSPSRRRIISRIVSRASTWTLGQIETAALAYSSLRSSTPRLAASRYVEHPNHCWGASRRVVVLPYDSTSAAQARSHSYSRKRRKKPVAHPAEAFSARVLVHPDPEPPITPNRK